MNAAEVLRKAQALIRERGWTQGTTEDEKGRVCLVGAIRKAGGGCDTATSQEACPECEPRKLVRSALGGEDEIRFNDHAGRSVDEVLYTLERAAVLAESQAGR